MQILAKFDGITEIEYKTYKENFMKRYELIKLPKYLIMCFRVDTRTRFSFLLKYSETLFVVLIS